MSRRAAESDVFMAVADPTRRAILDTLACGERSVGEIAGGFDVTLSAVSQHMKVLRDAGLVEARKEGRSRVYRLAPLPLRDVHDWSARYAGFWNEKLGALARTLDRMEEADERKG
jgi:DNA-binding transcriptional ArsR family regulator